MDRNPYNIVHLPRERWEGAVIPMRYTAKEYYDVRVKTDGDGYHVSFCKRQFETPVTHYPEEYDFPDKLYQPHWEKAFAWGIVEKEGGEERLLACIETCPEEWSNRLMVTELWVDESIRRRGIAHALMAIAKEQAVLEHRRAIILETQSCNTGAICFYQQEGFRLIGFDSCCYSNRDPERREVRIDMGYFPRRSAVGDELVIRREEEKDFYKTEEMTLKAFWNKYHMGCNEHLLVHKLRDCRDYVPELSRVAAVGDEIVGAIFYSRAYLKKENDLKEILTFGPLCVAPEWQGCGVGGRLLEETLKLARDAGQEGVVIFGEPDYYPRHGFITCDHFGITTREGKNFDAFMGIELAEGGLSGFGGSFYEAEVFEELTEQENEVFTKEFSAPQKQKFPCQWD